MTFYRFVDSVFDRCFTDICIMLNATVGKNLRVLRIMNDYSQEDVEVAINLSRSTLSKIENGTGRIDLDRLEKFATFFKVDAITILTMSDKQVKKAGNNKVVNENISDYRKTDVELARCQEKVNGLKKDIVHLKQEISNYKSQVKDKDLIIKLLSKK